MTSYRSFIDKIDIIINKRKFTIENSFLFYTPEIMHLQKKVLVDVIMSNAFLFLYISSISPPPSCTHMKEERHTYTHKRSQCKRMRRIVFVFSYICVCVYTYQQHPKREKVSQHTHTEAPRTCLHCQNEPE